MPALLCRVGPAACSLLLTTVARFGLRGLPSGGRMGPSVQGPWETGGWQEGLEIPSQLCLCCALASLLTVQRPSGN